MNVIRYVQTMAKMKEKQAWIAMRQDRIEELKAKSNEITMMPAEIGTLISY